MKIIIQTPGFKADAKLLNFVTKKLQKLDQLHNRIKECQVFLKLEKSDIQKNKTCEIKLVLPGTDLFASIQSQTFEAAVNNVIEALKRQLRDLKIEYKGDELHI